MMTYTYRKAKSEEREQCIELANYVFSTAHRPHDFETLIQRYTGKAETAPRFTWPPSGRRPIPG